MSQEGESIIYHETQTREKIKSKRLLSECNLFHESRRGIRYSSKRSDRRNE